MGRNHLSQRRGATSDELQDCRTDVMTGMFASNLIMYFIILTTGATLHASGGTNITLQWYLGSAPDKSVAQSTIVFPTPQLWSQTQNYYEFKSIADAQHWNSVFQPIYQS